LARQTNEQIRTKSKQGVRGTRGRQRLNGQRRELRQGPHEEPTHQRNVDRQLVSMQ
jgi:hypothetical protein